MIHAFSHLPWLLCLILITLVCYLSLRLYWPILVKKTNKKKSYMTADQALDKLLQGNNTYIQSGASKFDRKCVADHQQPFAIILTCSDSRVSPELIFNQLNVGSLFIVRNTGNILDEMVLGSIEYGVKYLKSPLVIVLGHERCGAITATVQAVLENHNECAVYIKNIIDIMKPTAQAVINQMNISGAISLEMKNQIIKNTAFANIRRVVDKISNKSMIISQALNEKKIKVIGAVYDLDHGSLQFID